MAEYSLNDVAHLASYRKIKLENYIDIFEHLWEGELIY
jgi:hypothetical protein